MRLRNIPAAQIAVASDIHVLHEPYLLRTSPGVSPLHVEIGMGKGQFLLSLAAEYPDIRFVGIERYPSVLYRALQKMEEPGNAALTNLSFICADAAGIKSMFRPGSIDVIYLNFSDPWPKKRHANRRLTSRQYLSRYAAVLSADGRIEMKTDNTGLFQFTLEELECSGWEILAVTHDLHHDPVLSAGNHMTEYEEKFSGAGNPILKVIAKP